MEIQVKKSTMVRPAQETPKTSLWCSNLDVVVLRVHVFLVYFYRPNGDSNFFDTRVLKESLSKVLVPFYPVAGRFRFDKDGRIEVNCNGEGVLFIEAQASCDVDDFVDFNAPSAQLKLLGPSVDYSKGISSFPLFFCQVTFFECGGVSLGIGVHHTLFDGFSAFHFINTWSDMTRGLSLAVEPVFDHQLIRARVPPSPLLDHVAYHFDQPPPLSAPQQSQESESSRPPISMATLKVTHLQLNTLKASVGGDYSTFEILAAHIWRCVCKARGLADDEVTNLSMPISGRSRLNPPLPRGYFGNAIFKIRFPLLVGEVQSGPLVEIVKRIHVSIKRVDDGYVRSVIDYMEVQPDVNLVRPMQTFKYPNLHIVSWVRFPIYDADFGWGRTIYMDRATIYIPGVVYILPSPVNDGSLWLRIGLEGDRIQQFQKYLYEPLHYIKRSAL